MKKRKIVRVEEFKNENYSVMLMRDYLEDVFRNSNKEEDDVTKRIKNEKILTIASELGKFLDGFKKKHPFINASEDAISEEASRIDGTMKYGNYDSSPVDTISLAAYIAEDHKGMNEVNALSEIILLRMLFVKGDELNISLEELNKLKAYIDNATFSQGFKHLVRTFFECVERLNDGTYSSFEGNYSQKEDEYVLSQIKLYANEAFSFLCLKLNLSVSKVKSLLDKDEVSLLVAFMQRIIDKLPKQDKAMIDADIMAGRKKYFNVSRGTTYVSDSDDAEIYKKLFGNQNERSGYRTSGR